MQKQSVAQLQGVPAVKAGCAGEKIPENIVSGILL